MPIGTRKDIAEPGRKAGYMPRPVTDGFEMLATVPHPAMSELVQRALRRRLSLGAVAKSLNGGVGRLQQSNVRRYFESRSPRRSTVDQLARVIGLSGRHIQLVYGEVLHDDEYGKIERALRIDLALHEAAFEEGAISRALGILSQLGKGRRIDVLGAYELQRLRQTAGLLPMPERDSWFDNDHPMTAFATKLQEASCFNLFGFLHRVGPTDATLWTLWTHLMLGPTSPFSERDGEAIIATTIGVLRGRGTETGPMEERLRRERAALQRAEMEVTDEGAVQ